MRHLRLLAFDLDYLIFDGGGAKTRTLRRGLVRYADFIPPDVRLPDDVDIEAAFAEHGWLWLDSLELPLPDEQRARLVAEVQDQLTAEGESAPGRLYPGIIDFLTWSRRQGLLLALGADSTRSYALSVSDRHRLDEFFDFVTCVEDCGSSGLAELLEDLMERAEVHPSECVYLGTRAASLEAARFLGLATVGCGWGLRDRSGIRNADREVDRAEDLAQVVSRLDELAVPGGA